MFTAVVTAVAMALTPLNCGAEEGVAYPLCESWETQATSDNCANPSGKGITINGERLISCRFDFPGKCFDVIGHYDDPLTYFVRVNR